MISRASLLAVLVLPYAAMAQAQDLRIEHVTIVSPERESPLHDATVTIHGGRITSITTGGATSPGQSFPKDITVINGKSLFLTPGLIDSHVHLGEIPGMTPEQETEFPDIARAARDQIPRSYLLYGFTTLIDLFSSPEDMARWKKHEVVPDTYFCGGAPLMDGYPTSFMPKPKRYQVSTMLIEPGMTPPLGIDPAMHTPVAVVAKIKAEGAICVKTYFERGFAGDHNLPVPKLETVRELVHAAHALGLPVLIHANSLEAQTFGVEAGVDILAHGLWNVPKGTDPTPAIKQTLDDVLAKNMGWQPTIQVLYGQRDLFDPSFLSDPLLPQTLPASLIDWYRTPEGQWFHEILAKEIRSDMPKLNKDDLEAQQAAMDRALAAPIARVEHATNYIASHGGRLLFGTDTPSAPTYANPPGLNGWLEMQRYVDAGVTPAQLFKAATLANAQALKLDGDIGTVQLGKRANLLLLRQDPTQTIQAYRGIAKVILGGRILDQAELAANRGQGSP